MDIEIQKRLDDQAEMLAQIHKSVEKTRKYFLAVLWVTIIMFVLPLIGLAFAIPAFLNSYGRLLGI
jgi:hypothetical protein